MTGNEYLSYWFSVFFFEFSNNMKHADDDKLTMQNDKEHGLTMLLSE